MKRVLNIILPFCVFLAFSCQNEAVPVPEVKPIINTASSNYYLKPYSVGEILEIPFSVEPVDSKIEYQMVCQDIGISLAPGEEEGNYILTLSARPGWIIERNIKTVILYIYALANERKTEKRLEVRMDEEGVPDIDGLPVSLFVYPYRADLSATVSFTLVNCGSESFLCSADDNLFEVSTSFDGRIGTLRVSPKNSWDEERFYGKQSGGYLNLEIENDYGKRTFKVPLRMPCLDVGDDELHFQYHGEIKSLSISSDLEYEYSVGNNVDVGDDEIWVTCEKKNGGLNVSALPIKRPGQRNTFFVVRDMNGVYERTVSVFQDRGDQYDYLDNVTDVEALWLMYYRESPERRAVLDNRGWGNANLSYWPCVLLQRSGRIIEFNWGGTFFPEEFGAFDMATGLYWQPQELREQGLTVTMEIPETIKKCSSLRDLSCSHSTVNGNVPGWLRDMNLRSLYLYNTLMSGPIPEWFAELEDVSVGMSRFSGEVPAVVKNSPGWKKHEDNWIQQDGCLLYYLDESGNKIYPALEGNP